MYGCTDTFVHYEDTVRRSRGAPPAFQTPLSGSSICSRPATSACQISLDMSQDSISLNKRGFNMRVNDVAGNIWVGRTCELAAAGGGDAHGVAAAAHEADALAQARVHHLGARKEGGELAPGAYTHSLLSST